MIDGWTASILSDIEIMLGGGVVSLTILMLLVGRNSGMVEGTRVCIMQWKKQNSYWYIGYGDSKHAKYK